MTYQHRFNELAKEVNIKGNVFTKIHNKVNTTNNFSDITDLADLAKAKSEFDIAFNEYHSFLKHVLDNNIAPNEILSNY